MEKPEIIVSFDDVKMKDFRAYWDAMRRGDYKEEDKFFAVVVKSWGYDLDPSDPDSYGELNYEQYLAVKIAVKQASGAFDKSLQAHVPQGRVWR